MPRACRLFRLVDAGDDAVGIGGSDEALGCPVLLGDEAVNGGLKVNNAAEIAPA